eukprot:8135503-Pyramimonas_sp.AAC.1
MSGIRHVLRVSVRLLVWDVLGISVTRNPNNQAHRRFDPQPPETVVAPVSPLPTVIGATPLEKYCRARPHLHCE